jgi:trimeric autotransporter adhesin
MTVEPRSGRISSLWARTPEVQTGAFSESVQAWRRREARRQTGASELSARSVVDIGQGGSKLSETGEQDGGGSSVLRMLSASFAGLTALTILSLAQASADTFSVTYQPMSEANGTVTAVAKVGGSVYLAGRFNYVGLHTGGAAFATEANATPSLAFPSFDGGASWQLSVEAEPFFVRVLNGHVVTGGAFIEAGGGARQGFAELDPSTGLPTSFAPTTTSDSDVSAIAVDGTTMYVGGEFSSFGGAARAGLAAFDTSTHSNLSWAPQLACSFCVGFNANATKLAAAGGRVYFSGQFDSVNGIAHRDVAGVDGSTGALLPFDPHGSFRTIKALAASSTAVYVGGVFTTLGGASRNNLAALDPTTGAATTWNPSPNGAINAIALSGDSVYLSGSFGQIAGVNRPS